MAEAADAINVPSSSPAPRPAPAPSSPRTAAWRHVSVDNPCLVCGKTDWCSLSADGAVALCRRVAEGGSRRVDRAGGEYWVHRLAPADPAVARHTPPPSGDGPSPLPIEAAAPDVLDRAYRAALGALALSDAHLAALQRRGLPEAEVRLRGYRTLADLEGALAAGAAAWGGAGVALARVPGFRRRPPAAGAVPAWVLSAHPGLLIPVRDAHGRIVALKVRRDDVEDGRPANPRYVYASSARWGGPGPGAPPHLPTLPAPPMPPPLPGVVRVTEGELKADVTTVLSGIRTVSVAGVGPWRSALPVLRALGVRRVLLAFDADAHRKPAVARALYALAWALHTESGFEVALEQWDEADGKGIDDLLAGGGRPGVVEGADVPRRLEALLPGGTGDAAAVRLGGVDVAEVCPAPLEAAMTEGLRLLGRWGVDRLRAAGAGAAAALVGRALRAGMAPGTALALLVLARGGGREEADAVLRLALRRAAG